MKKMNSILVALVAVLAAATASAQPQPPPPHGPPPLELIILHFADQIGLTADQVAQIESILEPARSEMEALHEAIRDAITSGEAADFVAADRALRERQSQILADVLAVLTDAQWHALQQVLPPPPPPPPAPPERQ